AEIMAGNASEVEIAGFLIALRTKGETRAEIAGLAATMRSLAARVSTSRENLVDTAGTGGGPTTFNVSTTAALIAAGAGCAVAKHGNRSATSSSGAADLLEALGADIALTPDAVGRCIDEVGFGFMFAPVHHAATRFVIPVRRDLAVRTIFNFLGPLTNPAGASRQVVGVSDPSKVEVLAGALADLGTDHALVVSAEDGLDEFSTAAPTVVFEVNGAEIERYVVDPADLGFAQPAFATIAGGTPLANAATTTAILDREQGPAADLALLNAGAAIYAARAADSIAEGVEAARESVASGDAATTLEAYVKLSQRYGAAAN
ncbi:MAG TPA: anthranilate phosphoribosyltransferase, partial [Baekduia sp.]|nr:anthranilate phosphoribosyltransferase [Baekduia sp.]